MLRQFVRAAAQAITGTEFPCPSTRDHAFAHRLAVLQRSYAYGYPKGRCRHGGPSRLSRSSRALAMEAKGDFPFPAPTRSGEVGLCLGYRATCPFFGSEAANDFVLS